MPEAVIGPLSCDDSHSDNSKQECDECGDESRLTVFVQNNLDQSFDVLHFCSHGCFVRGIRHRFGK